MRAALYCPQCSSNRKIMSQLKKQSFGGFAIIDFFEDLEDLDYCAYIRTYDFVFIYEDMSRVEPRKYLNILGSLNKSSTNFSIYFVSPSTISPYLINFYSEYTERNIKNASARFFDYADKERFVSIVTEAFSELYERVKNQENFIIEKMDFSKKEIVIRQKETENTYVIPFSRQMDLKILVTFFKYGMEKEVSINEIICSTLDEPEHTTTSPIEASISSIRKTFSSMFGDQGIELTSRKTYRLSLPSL